jgi:hypothetical protein
MKNLTKNDKIIFAIIYGIVLALLVVATVFKINM